jgi:phage N-6-adenine-methyltransferase
MSFVARNHPQQVNARGADDKTDDRRTPSSVFDPLHAEHGFTLDVAASAANAKCARYFDLEADGLGQPWTGEVVWCNPPYSDIASWVRKAIYEVQCGCRKVVMLLPANRTEQVWWQEFIEPVRDRPGSGIKTRNLRGRLKFEGPDGPIKKRDKKGGTRGTQPPFGCVLVIIESPSDSSSNESEGS